MTLPAIFAAALGALAVSDGDTLRDPETGMRFRLAEIDAPERGHRAQCVEEWALAEAARARLADLLPGAQVEYIGRVDSWNRPLVRLRLQDGRTAGDVLVSEGLAVPWTGARADWCAELSQ